MKTDKELLMIFAKAFYHMADDDPINVRDHLPNDGKDLEELYVAATNIIARKNDDFVADRDIPIMPHTSAITYTITQRSCVHYYKIEVHNDAPLRDHIVKLLNENPL